jgi:hypothetical protein
MSYPLPQQIEAVKKVVSEKRGAGEVVMAEALQAALNTLIGKAAAAGHVVPVGEVSAGLQASVTLYKQFEAEYRAFCLRETQLEARMDGGQGKALHAIIGYLRAHCTAKDDTGALASWIYVLNNWRKVPDFIQRQTTLTAINKYLTEIMLAIKKANQPAARVWPDTWSAAFEAKLKPDELSAYRAHLRGRGWRYNSQRQTWIAPE